MAGDADSLAAAVLPEEEATFAAGLGEGIGGLLGIRFWNRSAHEQLQLVILGQKVKALGRAARLQVQIESIAQDTRGHDGIVLMLLTERDKLIVDRLFDDEVILDPADFVLGSSLP